MGYKIDLPKEYSYIGVEILDAYHSIDKVSLDSGKVKINVGVYISRDVKYESYIVQSRMLQPKATIEVLLDDEGLPIGPIEDDIAQYSTVSYSPQIGVLRTKLGEYRLAISAEKLFPESMPYDLDAQRESLYPTVKKLLGHTGAEDVFEIVEDYEPALLDDTVDL